jgi:hypothetical protein
MRLMKWLISANMEFSRISFLGCQNSFWTKMKAADSSETSLAIHNVHYVIFQTIRTFVVIDAARI